MSTTAITRGAVTETTIDYGSNANGLGDISTVDIQYGTRRDFTYCIAPIFNRAKAATQQITGLNRRQTYFIRERGVTPGGVRQPWSNVINIATAAGTEPSAGLSAVLIEPAVIVAPVHCELSSSSGTIGGYDPVNMVDGSPSTGWRAFKDGSHRAAFTFWTAGALIDTVALLDTNLPETGQWRIIFFNSAGASIYDTGDITFRASAGLAGRRGYHGFHRRAAGPLAAAQVSVLVTSPTVPGGIFHVTHFIAGLARTSKNYSELTMQPFDLGALERQRDGSPVRIPGFRGRRVDFTISALTETQYETQYGDLSARVGLDEPILAVPNTKAGIYFHDRMLFGPLLSSRIGGARLRYERIFSIESIINP